jgi:hypothetical protein
VVIVDIHAPSNLLKSPPGYGGYPTVRPCLTAKQHAGFSVVQKQTYITSIYAS